MKAAIGQAGPLFDLYEGPPPEPGLDQIHSPGRHTMRPPPILKVMPIPS